VGGRADAVIGLLLLGLAGAVWWLSRDLPSPPFVPLTPAFFPRLLAAVLAGLSLPLLVRGLAAPAGAAAPARGPLAPTLLVFVPLGAYIWLAPRLGFFVTTFLFVLAEGLLLGERRAAAVVRAVAVAALTTAACYVVFTRYLQVLFPEGALR
jgi:putative tricarboxylic transport membrane protein